MPAGKATIQSVLLAALCLPGAYAVPRPARQDPESILLSLPSAEIYSRHLLNLTEEPHPAGSRRNMELADYVRDRFIEYGLEDVHFHDTPALLSRSVSASVELVAPVRLRLKLAEDPYPADKDSFLYRDPRVVPYHAYARSGDVTAETVYANSGSPEDFAALRKMNINLRGKIVVMRYSEPYSYRGYKVWLAETHGAAGAIIYSDPQDDGYAQGDAYPDGPLGPPSHVQLGSIVYDWLGPGEPFTFHWERGGGTWKEGTVRDRQLPKIPSIPMSYEDASEILSRLSGPAVPSGWQGGLPFTYHIGPGPVRVHLRVENSERIGTMRNVLGAIRGTAERDKWVVIGNHRDAWVYGAVDPGSGTAAMLEVARSLGAALRAGFRPRRTILFADWDAEEDLLGGSTSWAEQQRDRLLRDGVAYVNVDSGVSGHDFSGGSTPALAGFLQDATRSVHDPDGGGSVYDAWAARSRDGAPVVEDIVGATDYTAFQENIGMSCIDMSFGGPYGVYHSEYDDYFWISRIVDQGFRYGTTMARLWGLVTWRLANATVLPMRYSDYARKVLDYLGAIETKDAARPLALEQARSAARRWRDAALDLETRLREGPVPDDAAARQVNDLLVRVERAMTDGEGLKGRPFFKHLIYAPQPTYREEILPRLYEAIETGDRDSIPRYEAQLVAAFDRAALLLRQARGRLEEGA
ncbi:MAG: glutamate carboxypeptidase [Acidobacteria bacterium]|nr:MAG: glutamate carboxypeptidase [Acidobacteriota bacterium]